MKKVIIAVVVILLLAAVVWIKLENATMPNTETYVQTSDYQNPFSD